MSAADVIIAETAVGFVNLTGTPTICGGFGAGPLGVIAAGTGGDGLHFAVQRSESSVLGVFNDAAQSNGATFPDDALNPSNWTLVSLNPGAAVPLAQTVEKITDEGYLIGFDAVLTPSSTYILTISATMKMADGTTVACTQASFITLPAQKGLFKSFEPTDIANPQTTFDSTATSPALGSYQITDRGDVGLESGRTYLRKRVTRRIFTGKGEFFHLPSYGFNLPIKGLLRPGQLENVSVDARNQILNEPDVVDVSVQTTRRLDNVAQQIIRVQDTRGQIDTLPMPVPKESS